MVCNITEGSLGSGILPRRFVISLAGSCCNCNRDSSGSGSTDLANEDCSYFNGYFEVIQTSDSDRYVHEFPEDAPFNARTIELRLNSDPNQPEDCMHVCVSITFGEDEEGNPVGSVGWGAVVKSIDKLGTLRRRGTNTLCCWPQKIRVNPGPVPDYVTPQPEWMPGNPDDLNHAPFWPSLDFDLMEDSDYAPVRYANGELQLRIKDLSSEAFGIPWGHTRIYSNRLSNSHDYGNGFNWMVHEWPRLVQFKSPIEPKPVGVTTEQPRNGCTIALVRGTRNALWFDEVVDKSEEGTWQPRFNACHVLEHDKEEHLIRIFAPNGHVWEFYDFTCPTSREFEEKTKEQREAIAPGCLKRHIGPYGEETQEIVFTYKKCQLEKMERSALSSDLSSGAFNSITETFQYSWKKGRVESITLSRKIHGKENNVSRVKYSYYGEKETHGNEGDLKTVQVEFWDQGWKSRKDTLQYYAYETSSNSTYAQGMLKAVVGPDAYHRMKLAGKDPLTSGPDKNFSDLWIEYFSDGDVSSTSGSRRQKQLVRRIKSITLDRGGRAFAYKYEFSSSKSEASSNVWISKVSETRPDNSQVSVYSDGSLCTLAHALESREGRWIYRFDWKSYGQLYWLRTPAAVSSFSAQASGMLNSSYSAGKTYSLLYYDNPNFVGEVYMGKTSVTTSNPQQDVENRIRLHKFEYLPHQYQDKTVWYLRADINPQTNVAFQIEWLPKCYAGQGQLTLTLPPVPASQHGNNQQTSSTVKFNRFGLPVWSLDERGVKTSTTYYDELSVPQRIVTNTVEGEVLTTDLRADHFGRITRTYGPIHRAVTSPGGTQTERIRRANWTIFDDVEGVIISADGFQRAGGGVQIMNPVSASQIDRAGRSIQQVRAVVRNTNAPDRIRAIDLSSPRSWCRRIVIDYNDRNQLKTERVYYDIPNGRYFETQYETYDAMYRPQIVVAPDGTRTESQYNTRGLLESVSMGGYLRVVSLEYDHRYPGGNGNITKVTRYVDQSVQRYTRMIYDWRDLVKKQWVTATNAPSEDAIGSYYWDDASQLERELLKAIASFDSSQVAKRDSRGQLYRNNYIRRSELNPFELDPVEQMSDLIWRDQSGNVIKHRPAGSLGYFKMQYDSLGRERSRFWGYNESPNAPLADPGRRSPSDVVLEQTEMTYDALGQPRQARQIRTGPTLQNEVFNGQLTDQRTTYSETFYDPLGRVVATVDYGTGQPIGGEAIPPSTDYTLVTRFHFNDRGELDLVASPSGEQIATTYDDAGRAVNTVESDARVPRRISRNNLLPDGRVESIVVTDPQRGTSHTTVKYLYGPQNSHLPFESMSNSLVAKKIDADGTATTYGYNRLGEVTSMKDARGVVHEYRYDKYGRGTDDIVASFGPGLTSVDTTTRRINRVYDDRGRVVQIRTFRDSTGQNELTSVQREYTFFDQVREEVTWVDGDYSKGMAMKFAGFGDILNQDVPARENTIRPERMLYPSNRSIRFQYGLYADNATGRVTNIQNFGTSNKLVNEYVGYAYWGQSEIYQVRLDANSKSNLVFNLGFGNGRSFSALDSLDRLKTLRWIRSGNSSSTVLQFNYQHRRNSQVSARELRDAAGFVQQDQYVYDGLNRLDKFTRKGEDAQEQSWQLDALGNWRKWDVRNAGSDNLRQSRTYGPGDRIKSITNASQETPWAQPGYDATGNLIAYPNPQQPEVGERVTYDAWNRPVNLTSNFTRFTYDGLGRLVLLDSGTGKRRFTYTPDWQLLEEEITPQEGSPYRYEYVWGIRGPDDLICREKYDSQSNLLERLYSLSDANGNIVGLISEAEDYLNRLITYDPYGTPTGESHFRQLFGGYYYDSDTGLYLVRNRVYHPKLGRWLTKDPLGMVDGPNLYEYCAGDPVNLIDPSGEAIPLALLLFFGAGALVGALHGGLETNAALGDEATTWDYGLGIGLGGLFGSINPVGEFYSAGGAIVGGSAEALGGGEFLGTGFQAGGLIGSVAGGFGSFARQGLREAAEQGIMFGSRRAAAAYAIRTGGRGIAWEAAGTAIGAGAGYLYYGDAQGALHGATLGNFAGNIGAIGNGLRSANRTRYRNGTRQELMIVPTKRGGTTRSWVNSPSLFTRLRRWVYDPRPWKKVSAERWKARGGAGDQSFEHFFIRQVYAKRHTWLTGFSNSYINSGLIIPQGLNSQLGNNFWLRQAFRARVLGLSATAFGAGSGLGYAAFSGGNWLYDAISNE